MEREIINFSENHGVTVADRSCPVKFPAHWHNALEFTVVFDKGCIYRIGDVIYKPQPGDILLVWPRELHEIKHMPARGSFFIQFSYRMIENNTDLASAKRFLCKCHHISAEKEPELVKKITDLLYKIKDIYSKKEYFIETKCKIQIYEILLLIGEHVMKEHRELIGNENFSDKAWDYIRTACSYISEHSAEEITQAEVAAETGLSPYYFSKIFKEYTRMTFPAYLAGIRVQNAINLLSNESLSITECAFQAGFQSTTTFNKTFLESTGCTPREFRKLHSHGGI